MTVSIMSYEDFYDDVATELMAFGYSRSEAQLRVGDVTKDYAFGEDVQTVAANIVLELAKQ